MKKALCILFFFGLLASQADAQRIKNMETLAGRVFFTEEEGHLELRKIFKGFNKDHHENPRLVAIALDLSLGLLGVHRLYLGTDVKIPVIYTLTFGGGAVLWVIDLGLLIFSKDITPYMDNPNLFMWTGKK